jgi:hypothetical protein
MSTPLSRSGDIVSLDEFNRELLASMLGEEVPQTLPVGQARSLVVRVRAISAQGMQYSTLLNDFLLDLDALLGEVGHEH